MFLAIDNNEVIGLIMGTIPAYDKFDYLDYKCPRRGIIKKFIVSLKSQKRHWYEIMQAMENYFLDYLKIS